MIDTMKVQAQKQHHFGRLTALLVGVAALAAGFLAWYWYTSSAEIARDEQALTALMQQVDTRIAEIEAKKNEPVYITLKGADSIRALVEDYNDPSSLWAMANKQRSLPMNYKPADLKIPNVPTRTDKSDEERSVRGDVTGPLKKLFDAAEKDGHKLMIGSAYRSASLQTFYFNSYVASSGLEAANQYSAKPGQSEHQLGLSVDISTLSQQCYLSECFTSTPDGQWLARNAYKYGFHLRYPLGKEAITGYNFEPWHYRYVGVDLATALYQSGLTLEEAWPSLQTALTTLKENRAL